MEIANTVARLKELLLLHRSGGATVALVPTMGALHKGHISLIEVALQTAEVVVCSIFVNPTQFTDPKDLEKYPRPLEHDIRMLTEAGCTIVFMPTVQEMYPTFPIPEPWHIDLGPAEFVLEGEFRKGHYQGVTQIVKKLFDAVEPDIALFGQKDYQQVLMIKNMVKYFDLPVRLISCPIIREYDGLAMSSRNIHLTPSDRRHALILSKALQFVRDNYSHSASRDLIDKAKRMIQETPGVELDYFTIVDGETLMPRSDSASVNGIVLVAAKVGETRLIDNVILS